MKCVKCGRTIEGIRCPYCSFDISNSKFMRSGDSGGFSNLVEAIKKAMGSIGSSHTTTSGVTSTRVVSSSSEMSNSLGALIGQILLLLVATIVFFFFSDGTLMGDKANASMDAGVLEMLCLGFVVFLSLELVFESFKKPRNFFLFFLVCLLSLIPMLGFGKGVVNFVDACKRYSFYSKELKEFTAGNYLQVLPTEEYLFCVTDEGKLKVFGDYSKDLEFYDNWQDVATLTLTSDGYLIGYKEDGTVAGQEHLEIENIDVRSDSDKVLYLDNSGSVYCEYSDYSFFVAENVMRIEEYKHSSVFYKTDGSIAIDGYNCLETELEIASWGGEDLKSVVINSKTFPDEKFRAYVTETFDSDGDGFLSLYESCVKVMDVSNREISDLKGIEYFQEMLCLDCSNNTLNKIDLYSNEVLRYLDCSTNELTELFYGRYLSILYCNNNQLTEMDLSVNLLILDCSRNRLERIDISDCATLLNLYNQHICYEESNVIYYSGSINDTNFCELTVDANTEIVTK